MRRVATLVVAVLAVFALATVAASLDTVSTELTVETAGTPKGTANLGGDGGGSRVGGDVGRDTPDDIDVSSGNDTGSETQVPLWQVVGGVGLLLVGGVVALYGLTGGSEADEEGGGLSDPEPTAPAAETATLAADVPASNDVYRAWNALCRTVPTESAGRTPADIARAAVEAGHAGDAVAELTDSFCAVRYGDADPTTERERRAMEIAAALSLSLEDSS